MNFKDNFSKGNIYFETENGILYNGDCLTIMKTFPKENIDTILTDPPYGTTACKWDSIIPLDEMWQLLKKIRKDNSAIILFGDEPFSSYLRISNIKEWKYDLIWEKEKPTNFFQLKRRFGKVTEIISIFYKKQCFYNPQKYTVDYRVNNKPKGKHNSIITGTNKEVLPYNDDGTRYPKNILKFNRVKLKKYLHPTQKPLELIEYLIKTFTNENDIILDFTSGSGTTLLAAEKLGRKWIGIELSKEYCEITKKRIEDYLNKDTK